MAKSKRPPSAARSALVCGALGLTATLLSPATSAEPQAATRWTAETPDEMADLALARAKAGGADALAALVTAAALDERAAFGRVRSGLAAIAASSSPLADDARWLGLRLEPSPAPGAWPGWRAVSFDVPSDASGLVRAFAILGPFQDTGGGLMRREGPEAPGQSFSDMTANHAWGVYDVSWRRVLPSSATARGVPLDLYIHPRPESCTYLASRVSFSAGASPVVVRVASSGAVRLLWDGADVAASEDVHPRLVVDRLAARIERPAGEHLVAVKVCSAAVPDEGRVRVRFTGEGGKPAVVRSSSDLSALRLASAAPAPGPAGVPGDRAMGAGGKPPRAKRAAGKPAAPKPPPEAESAAISPPAGVVVVATALEQGLATAGEPSAEEALRSSILRTLCGAEDLRSPRAPGLLDRVAKSAGVTADTLAMAGWVSPFGANRSGWLNLARDRGVAEGDRAAASFAERRLAASHLGNQFAEWALAAADGELLRSARDAEARLLRALARKHLGGNGLAKASLDELSALASELGGAAPLSVYAELSELARTDPPVLLSAARRLAELRADSRGPGFVRAHRTIDGAAHEVAAASAVSVQKSADDLLQIGRDLLDSGRYAWAREIFFVATKLAPNRAGAFHGLSAARRALAEAELRAGKAPSEDPALANAALARARDLEPGDVSLKAELAFRTGRASPEERKAPTRQVALRDEGYMVPPARFLAEARQRPAKRGEVFDRQPHWVRVVTYHPDKRVSQLMHYSREIVIEPRTDDERYERLPSEGDQTELLLARVHRKDGTVAPPDEQSAGRRPVVRWPELHEGDVVEVAVRSWTGGPVGRRGDPPFYFIDYVGSTDTHPILYNEVVIDSPAGSPLAIDVLGGKAQRVVESRDEGRLVQRFIWDDPVMVPDEPLAPKLSESVPVVVGSTFASWGDFREWYRGAVRGMTEPDDQIRRLAAELTKGKASREAKLEAIFEFVADHIRYVNFVSGEWWLPNRPQELLARRQGDCDDKAILLISLLRAIGIEATEVLVQTRYTSEPALLRSERVAIPMFDHGIAYLPGKNGAPGTWLDATSPQSRMGPLPAMDARAVALFVDEGPPVVVDTPASTPDDHGISTDWTVTLGPSGAGDIVAKERHVGDAAFELRNHLRESDTRAQWVEQYLANGWFPTVQVESEVAFDGELPNGAATLAYRAHTEGLARREGGELAVPVYETQTLTSQLAPLVKRTLPVVLPPSVAPSHRRRTITIVAPAGFTFAELPPGGEASGGDFGRAKLSFKRAPGKPDKVIVERSIVVDRATIPVEKYAAWRAWVQSIDGLMHRTVRLVPDRGAAKAPKVSAP